MTAFSKPLQSSFDEANAALAGRTEAMLRQCISRRLLLARLLNTLSLLEHMGTLRIMATQSGAGTEEATLRHVAEEARHAAFFRRQAEKTAGGALGYAESELAAPAAARLYFRRLDAVVRRALRADHALDADGRGPYLYMSMTVEFRALWLYRLFDRMLRAAEPAIALRTVLGEEEAHLEQMASRLQALGAFDAGLGASLCRRETALYRRLLAALEVTVLSAV